MLGKRLTTLSGCLEIIEGVLEFAAVLLCVVPDVHVTAEHFQSFFQTQISIPNAASAGCFMLLWIFSVRPLNFTKSGLIESEGRFVRGLKEYALAAILLCGYLFVIKQTVNASLVIIFFAICLFFRMCRLGLEHWLESRDPQLVIILGSGYRAGRIWREIRTRFHSTVKLVGFVDDRSISEMPPDVAGRYLGTIDDLDRLLFANTVDKLLVAMPMKSCYDRAQRAIAIAEQAGVQVLCMQDIYKIPGRQFKSASRALFSELLPLHEWRSVRRAVKRCVDFFGALICFSLFIPMFLLIAATIKMTGKGPVFLAEDRLGYRRRVFRIYSFNIFGNKRPLLACLARFLRKSSLDKLPLLLNVLIGNMSFVGPRPMSVRDISIVSKAALMRRFTVKPGLTGLWNVTQRNSLCVEKSIETDFRYIDDWSLALDFHILLKTMSVVFTRALPV